MSYSFTRWSEINLQNLKTILCMNHSSLLWNFPLRTPCRCAQRFLERSESQDFAQLVKASLVSCVWDVRGTPSGHGPSWWIVRQAEKSQSVFIGCSPCARHNSTCFAKAKAFSLRGRAMATALSSTLSDNEGSECRQHQCYFMAETVWTQDTWLQILG